MERYYSGNVSSIQTQHGDVSWPLHSFTATCDYVKTLITPNEYEQKLTDFIRLERSLANHTGRFVNMQFLDFDERMGFGRYAAEHWILSSPESIPCDLDGEQRGVDAYQLSKNVTNDAFVWGMYPHEGQTTQLFHEDLVSNKSLRVKDYFLLAGNLLKWFHLYDKLPPKGSWVYQIFPDGKEWEEAVEEFGVHAQEVMFSRSLNRSLWSSKTS